MQLVTDFEVDSLEGYEDQHIFIQFKQLNVIRRCRIRRVTKSIIVLDVCTTKYTAVVVNNAIFISYKTLSEALKNQTNSTFTFPR